MPVIIKIEGADLKRPHDLIGRVPSIKDGPIPAIGDLHGNALYALTYLIAHEVIEIGLEDTEQLIRMIEMPVADITIGHKLEFDRILATKIIYNQPNYPLPFSGDEVCDRGPNDFFTLKLFDALHTHQVPYEIAFSNHGESFLRAFMLYRLEGIHQKLEGCLSGEYAQSMSNMGNLIQRGIITRVEVLRLINKSLLPFWRHVLYTIEEEENELPLISSTIHAPSGLEVIEGLATQTYKTGADLTTVAAFKETVEKINNAFQVILRKNGYFNLDEIYDYDTRYKRKSERSAFRIQRTETEWQEYNDKIGMKNAEQIVPPHQPVKRSIWNRLGRHANHMNTTPPANADYRFHSYTGHIGPTRHEGNTETQKPNQTNLDATSLGRPENNTGIYLVKVTTYHPELDRALEIQESLIGTTQYERTGSINRINHTIHILNSSIAQLESERSPDKDKQLRTHQADLKIWQRKLAILNQAHDLYANHKDLQALLELHFVAKKQLINNKKLLETSIDTNNSEKIALYFSVLYIDAENLFPQLDIKLKEVIRQKIKDTSNKLIPDAHKANSRQLDAILKLKNHLETETDALSDEQKKILKNYSLALLSKFDLMDRIAKTDSNSPEMSDLIIAFQIQQCDLLPNLAAAIHPRPGETTPVLEDAFNFFKRASDLLDNPMLTPNHWALDYAKSIREFIEYLATHFLITEITFIFSTLKAKYPASDENNFHQKIIEIEKDYYLLAVSQIGLLQQWQTQAQAHRKPSFAAVLAEKEAALPKTYDEYHDKRPALGKKPAYALEYALANSQAAKEDIRVKKALATINQAARFFEKNNVSDFVAYLENEYKTPERIADILFILKNPLFKLDIDFLNKTQNILREKKEEHSNRKDDALMKRKLQERSSSSLLYKIRTAYLADKAALDGKARGAAIRNTQPNNISALKYADAIESTAHEELNNIFFKNAPSDPANKRKNVLQHLKENIEQDACNEVLSLTDREIILAQISLAVMQYVKRLVEAKTTNNDWSKGVGATIGMWIGGTATAMSTAVHHKNLPCNVAKIYSLCSATLKNAQHLDTSEQRKHLISQFQKIIKTGTLAANSFRLFRGDHAQNFYSLFVELQKNYGVLLREQPRNQVSQSF